MNGVRRVFLALYSLVFLAALGGIGALAWNQDQQLDLKIDKLKMQAFVDASNGAKWALTGALAGIALIGLYTLLAAIWPSRSGYSSKGTLRIKQADGGTVEVTAEAVESLLKVELEALPEVRSAAPRVKLAGGAVDTYVDANIEPSASIAQATKLLSGTIEQVLKEHVGVTAVRRPVIRITYDEMGVRPAGVTRPAPYQPAIYPPSSPPEQPRGMAPETQMKPPLAPDPARPPEAPVFAPPADVAHEGPTDDDRS
jgi:hypothetical protein